MTNHADLSQENVVEVFTTQNELEARMVQEILWNSGIESTINSEMVPSVFPLNTGSAGKYSILVLQSTAKEARQIIAEQYESGSPADLPDSA